MFFGSCTIIYSYFRLPHKHLVSSCCAKTVPRLSFGPNVGPSPVVEVTQGSESCNEPNQRGSESLERKAWSFHACFCASGLVCVSWLGCHALCSGHKPRDHVYLWHHRDLQFLLAEDFLFWLLFVSDAESWAKPCFFSAFVSERLAFSHSLVSPVPVIEALSRSGSE